MEKLTGKHFLEAKRKDMEENASTLIEKARFDDMAILVPGDPLVATTHMALVIEARKKGVDVRVIHGSSVYSAIASTGLSIYKFGKTTTIPRIQEGYEPTSFYDTIVENLRVGAHTLCLLDVGERPMNVREAIERLQYAERLQKKGVAAVERHVVVASFGETDTVAYASIGELKVSDFPTPAVLIVPATLSDIEKEALESAERLKFTHGRAVL